MIWIGPSCRCDDEDVPTCFTKGKTIFGFFLALSDFISDVLVGINFYKTCHYRFAITSFFFTAFPSIIVLILTITIHIFNYQDVLVFQLKNNGLNHLDLLGLILCFPIYNSFIGKYLQSYYYTFHV